MPLMHMVFELKRWRSVPPLHHGGNQRRGPDVEDTGLLLRAGLRVIGGLAEVDALVPCSLELFPEDIRGGLLHVAVPDHKTRGVALTGLTRVA